MKYMADYSDEREHSFRIMDLSAKEEEELYALLSSQENPCKPNPTKLNLFYETARLLDVVAQVHGGCP